MYIPPLFSLLVIYAGFIPFYIAIAGWSFKVYSLKSNSSIETIDDFRKHLRFPGTLVFWGNPPLITRIAGKEFVHSDLQTAQFQRWLIFIILFVMHILLASGIRFADSLIEVLYTIMFIGVSMMTLLTSPRFGRQLLTNVRSP